MGEYDDDDVPEAFDPPSDELEPPSDDLAAGLPVPNVAGDGDDDGSGAVGEKSMLKVKQIERIKMNYDKRARRLVILIN